MKRAEAAAIARAAKAKKAGPIERRFWVKVSVGDPRECWPWTAAMRTKGQQYGAFWLDGRHQPANRVAWELANGPLPTGMMACHRCDNPACCNPAHIFAGTGQDNNDDKVFKGRNVRGADFWNTKLTAAHVAEIRAHRPVGAKRVGYGVAKQLAQKFGVTAQYISEIFAQKSWRPE